MATQHSYSECSLYEALIRRAYMQIDRSKNGAHSANMTNLIDAENGESWVSHLPKYDKQFSKVQSYLRKALNKILKWKLADDEKSILIEQQLRLDNSTDSASLMAIVRAGLAVSQRFKEGQDQE